MWRDEAYLLDMLLAGRKIRAFTADVDENRFRTDEVLQHAVMRLIQIIGEAARKISSDFRQSHPEIPWRDIVGMRHLLVHEYFRIVPEKVWEVVERDLSDLITMIEPLVPPDSPA
ncbi:MAG: DUF86 domain-containing protein [Planctomycetes bacterium]|nr:DUF86 domain-containing protein [Planctomycetota bacterium]MBU4398214.1 DUF86 domain-containing protein [Planctomycetota bacterium]MCG2684472.1 DUF86 domain-containing protein [Planctomycetales bacterium]